jgi:hypothetical protein
MRGIFGFSAFELLGAALVADMLRAAGVEADDVAEAA